MSHIINPTKTEGTRQEVLVDDDTVQGLLHNILKELMIMNIHLAMMTDTIIEDREVES